MVRRWRQLTPGCGSVPPALFRERSADFVDVSRRILSSLLDREMESLENLDHPCIVVAHDLTPSETVNMDMTNTLGLATDAGGPTSHMAILARAFEIPSVVGLNYLLQYERYYVSDLVRILARTFLAYDRTECQELVGYALALAGDPEPST